MSQTDFLRSMDAIGLGHFAALGASDVVCWEQLRGGLSQDSVPVLIDRAINLIGIDGGVPADSIVMSIFAANVGRAVQVGDLIGFNGGRFRVDRVIDRDESRTLCVIVERS